jgi:hypothetical protein
MGKGYAEGPAAEEAERLREEIARGDAGERSPGAARQAVYGATRDDPAKHFIGWLDEVDPDTLFASGSAWGLSIVRRSS